jgi:hypothetical protein
MRDGDDDAARKAQADTFRAITSTLLKHSRNGVVICNAWQMQDVWNERAVSLSRAQNNEYEIEPHDILFLAFEPRRSESR